MSIKHIVSVFKIRIITDRDRNEFKNLCDKWTIVVEHPPGSGCKCLAIKPWLENSNLERQEEGLDAGAAAAADDLADAPERALAGNDRSPGRASGGGEGAGDYGSGEECGSKKIGGLVTSPIGGGHNAARRVHHRQVVTTGTSPPRSL